jgi:hypothetical protein
MPDPTDAELLADLRALLADGAVVLDIDSGKLNHMDSPVGVEAEANRWLLALIAVCGAAAWFGGWLAGLAALVASIALWLGYVRKALHRRVERRVQAKALADVQTWRRLWRFGGVRLVAGDAVCAAPADNWMGFVRERRPRAP